MASRFSSTKFSENFFRKASIFFSDGFPKLSSFKRNKREHRDRLCRIGTWLHRGSGYSIPIFYTKCRRTQLSDAGGSAFKERRSGSAGTVWRTEWTQELSFDKCNFLPSRKSLICRSYDIIWRSVIFPLGLECCYYTATFSLLQVAGNLGMSVSAFSHSNIFRCVDVIRCIPAAFHPDRSATSQWIRRSFSEKQFDRIPRDSFHKISRRFHSLWGDFAFVFVWSMFSNSR